MASLYHTYGGVGNRACIAVKKDAIVRQTKLAKDIVAVEAYGNSFICACFPQDENIYSTLDSLDILIDDCDDSNFFIMLRC